jgi:hypothetical protein
MPKYHFHLHDDLDVPDEDGSELPDLAAAEARAVLEARELMCELLKKEGRIALHYRIDIEDAGGNVLATVPFRDVVKIED